LDDHEIMDNFGSSPEHADERYAALREGAIDAYYDYQARRTLREHDGQRPRAFYHGFEYGTVGVFVMDLRSERHAEREEISVYSDRQLTSLQEFLERCASKHVLFVVLSVPILHVPDWLAKLGIAFASRDGDLQDRWSNPRAQKSRNRFLAVIREHQRRHPSQRTVLLGGDVHVGVAARLRWGDGIRDTYQLVSSAVSNVSEFNLRRIVEAMPSIDAEVGDEGFSFTGELLQDGRAEHGSAHANPYGELNCSIVEIERVSESESTVRLLLLGSGNDDAPEPLVVFDSGRL
jgi:alkaline phosphatase D